MKNCKQIFLLTERRIIFDRLSFDKISEVDSKYPQLGIRFMIPIDAKMKGL